MDRGSDGSGAGSLSITALGKNFGKTRALADVDLTVAAGEFVALLGPSGCGKTTLLRCVAGLIEADAGEIAVDGRPIGHVPPWKRDISVVFQSYALFPHMSVAQNVAFGLRMRGLDKATIASRLTDALGLVRMEEFRDRLPAQLSGGQQQRVALARAIVVRPRILLLDEPMAALDAKLRTSVQREIRELQTKLGITTILVTHDQAEAMSMSDRIAVMSGGRVEQFADPLTLYARPATPFVAEFVGEINRIHGSLEERDGLRWFHFAAKDEIAIPVPAEAKVGQGAATFMLRPESVRVSRREGSPDEGVMSATIADRVLVGDRITLYLRTGDLTLRSVVLNTDLSGAVVPAAGTEVAVDWPMDAPLFFPGHV